VYDAYPPVDLAEFGPIFPTTAAGVPELPASTSIHRSLSVLD